MNGLPSSPVYNSKGRIEAGNTYPIVVFQVGLDEEAKYRVKYGTFSKDFTDSALANQCAVNLSEVYHTVGHQSKAFVTALKQSLENKELM